MIHLDTKRWWLWCFLLLFTFLTHVVYIPNGYTWLDHRDIEKHHAILPLPSLYQAFVARYSDTGFYRPLVTITNSLDAALYQNYPPGYHLTNVLLFTALIGFIPFFLARYSSLSFTQSLCAALFVAVHPYGFLPVGSISYRPELLFTLFILLALYFHCVSVEKKSAWSIGLAGLCFACALFSKETTLVLFPATVGLWEMSGRYNHRDKRMLWSSVVFYSGIVIGYISLRMYAVPEVWRVSIHFPSLSTAIGTRLSIVGKLLWNFLLPISAPISDVTPIVPLTNSFSLLTLSFLGGVIFLLMKKRLPSTLVNMVILFLLFLSPALSIVPVPRMSSPHYGFIGLIPMGACIIFGATRLLHKKSISSFARWAVILICIVWLITASVQTIQSGSRFYDDQRLFQPEIATSHQFYEGYFYLGNFYLQRQEYKKAEINYQLALSRQETVIAYQEPLSILTNLAAVYYAQKQYAHADTTLQQALRYANPEQQETIIYNRALIAKDQKNYQKVISLLSNSNQQNPLAQLLLADALHNLNREAEARNVLLHSLPLWPENQRVHIQNLIRSLTIN